MIGHATTPPPGVVGELLSETADRINLRNRAAKIAQTESLELFQTLYFEVKENFSLRIANGFSVFSKPPCEC